MGKYNNLKKQKNKDDINFNKLIDNNRLILDLLYNTNYEKFNEYSRKIINFLDSFKYSLKKLELYILKLLKYFNTYKYYKYDFSYHGTDIDVNINVLFFFILYFNNKNYCDIYIKLLYINNIKILNRLFDIFSDFYCFIYYYNILNEYGINVREYDIFTKNLINNYDSYMSKYNRFRFTLQFELILYILNILVYYNYDLTQINDYKTIIKLFNSIISNNRIILNYNIFFEPLKHTQFFKREDIHNNIEKFINLLDKRLTFISTIMKLIYNS